VSDTVDVYIVAAYSLESLRTARQTAMPIEYLFDRLEDKDKPQPTDLARFFTHDDADAFMSRLHTSWFRPAIRVVKEPVADQHYSHGGTVGK
jgi:hypothetical protein